MRRNNNPITRHQKDERFFDMKKKQFLTTLLCLLSTSALHAATFSPSAADQEVRPPLSALNIETATREQLEQAFLAKPSSGIDGIQHKIMPIWLKRYGLESIESAINVIERNGDNYSNQFTFILNTFNEHLNEWLDGEIRSTAIRLIRSAPGIFTFTLDASFSEIRPLYLALLERSKTGDAEAELLAFELIEHARTLSFFRKKNVDVVQPHLSRFQNVKKITSFPFTNDERQLFDLSNFHNLTEITFFMSRSPWYYTPGTNEPRKTVLPPLMIDQVTEWASKIPASISNVRFDVETIDDLIQVRLILSHMKRSNNLSVNISSWINLVNLSKTHSELFEWFVPNLSGFPQADFLHFEDKMHLFRNIQTIQNIPLSLLDEKTYDFSVFGKLRSITFSAGEGQNEQNLSHVDQFIQRLPEAVKEVHFSDIRTHEDLVKAYNIGQRINESRTGISVQAYNFNLDMLTKSNEAHYDALTWVAPYIGMLSNISIAGKDGRIDLEVFSHISHFVNLTNLHLTCGESNYDALPQLRLSEGSYAGRVALLPLSLQSIDLTNLHSIKWGELEFFIDTLITERPNIAIHIGEQKSHLSASPKILEWLEQGRVTCYPDYA